MNLKSALPQGNIPPNALPHEKVEDVKLLLNSINPATGHVWGIREISDELKISRNIVSDILLKMRRKENKAYKQA